MEECPEAARLMGEAEEGRNRAAELADAPGPAAPTLRLALALAPSLAVTGGGRLLDGVLLPVDLVIVPEALAADGGHLGVDAGVDARVVGVGLLPLRHLDGLLHHVHHLHGCSAGQGGEKLRLLQQSPSTLLSRGARQTPARQPAPAQPTSRASRSLSALLPHAR